MFDLYINVSEIKVPVIEKLLKRMKRIVSGTRALVGPWMVRRESRAEAEADAQRIKTQGVVDSMASIAEETRKIWEGLEPVGLSMTCEASIGESISVRLKFQEEKLQRRHHVRGWHGCPRDHVGEVEYAGAADPCSDSSPEAAARSGCGNRS